MKDDWYDGWKKIWYEEEEEDEPEEEWDIEIEYIED